MKLVQKGTNRVIAEADQYEVDQRVRVAMPIKPESSDLFNAALPDEPIIVEWEVIAVDMTRNLAIAALRDVTGPEEDRE